MYYSHDYHNSTLDKNQQLIETATIAKAYNVKNLIAVTPIEFANYQTMNLNDCPIRDLNESISKSQ